MHYYNFNIADYQSHTRHLTLTQDICYRRMLDYIYLHEKPLPVEINEIGRKLLLNECLTDVEQVLNEFFTLVEQGYINVRAMSEISAYKAKQDKASKAGKASGKARKNKIKQSLNESEQAFNERSTDVEPNKNQETINKKQVKRSISDDFSISDNVRKWASEKGYDNLEKHLEYFINACKAKDYKYIDWDRAFMKAISDNWAKVQKSNATPVPEWKRGLL